MNGTIIFDAKKLKALRKAYDAAVDAERESFMFEGRVFVTSYAKYLLEYFEGKLK